MKEIVSKKFKKSSRKWLQRQLNDPFVQLAKQNGYRSRASFKIIEIQEKFKIFQKNQVVVDLGSSPGGWSQIASKHVNKIIAVDLLDMDSIHGVFFIKEDFLSKNFLEKMKTALKTEMIDVVMSDMAPSTCGIKKIDHLKIINLVEQVFCFSVDNLKPGGHMIAKVFQGGTEYNLLANVKKVFEKVYHFKPKSSRKESAEIYLIAKNFQKTNKY